MWLAWGWRFARTHARGPAAAWWLALLSAAEAVCFPVPPDALLAPLAAAHPKRAWFFVVVTTFASLAGGVAGYLLGFVAFEAVGKPLLAAVGAASYIPTAQAWFAEHTALLLFLAAFTPIPYKVFTLTAGALAAPLVPFLTASLAGRALRFFLVGWTAARFGERAVRAIAPRANIILLVGGVVVLGYLIVQLARGY